MPVARGAAALGLTLDVLAREGSLWVREASPSMLPLIRPGDELRLAPVSPGQVFRGTLVACRQDARLIIHRVIARDAAGVVTKGDALTTPDPAVPWDRVVARVLALRSPAGRVVELDGFPWSVLNRLLGAIAAMAIRLSGSGLVWKALRLPFHAARLLLP